MGNCVGSSWCKLKQRACDLCTGKRSSGVCACPNTVASCSCPPNAAPSPSCVFYSPRIQGLLEGHRTEEETTKDHWTEVDSTSEATGEVEIEVARVAEDNRKYFDEVLVKHPEWGAFFSRFEDLEVGAKIGEGGQAEIFAAECPSFRYRGKFQPPLVAKVFKADVLLKELQHQWPPQMLSTVVQGPYEWPSINTYGGTFIRDGMFKNRFAFVMERCWTDLRTFIDRQMLELLRNHSHGPPFRKIHDVYAMISEASNNLCRMHEIGILHRDIKASNILMSGPSNDDLPVVADFECSVGVTGTKFWRAPEILEQLQNKVPIYEVVFTKKCDIYSFGMMCYEVITGCIPFEGHPSSDYSIVLSGERPNLPQNLDLKLKKLVLDCWQHDPELRPTSSEIFKRLSKTLVSTVLFF